MTMKKWITLFSLGLSLVSCSNFQLRPDQAPSPIDPSISETRLEFVGCNEDHPVGTVICLPGDTLSVVTEFPGDLIYFSSGATCSLRVEHRATVPLTPLELPAETSVCPIIVYYLPDYPSASSATMQIKGLFGEVELQPDKSYTPLGKNVSQTTSEIVTLKFPEAVRGAFVSRQLEEPREFVGDTLHYHPLSVGTDLIQIKLWMPDGTNQFKLISANYFSPFSLQLELDISKDQKNLLIQFPETVSVTTANHTIHTDLQTKLPLDFTGDVRAYTVQGRTALAHFEKGVLSWIK